jgi:hypothetical protein
MKRMALATPLVLAVVSATAANVAPTQKQIGHEEGRPRAAFILQAGKLTSSA